MSSSKRKSESGINNLSFDVNSDSETDVYWDSDESANLSSDEFSSDSDVSDSESVNVADARVWCRVDSASPPAPPSRFPFTGNPGLQVPLADKSDPLAYLCLFLDDELIDHIVVETNRYAEQTLARTPQRRLSRTRQWEPGNQDDMWLFVGIMVLQALVHKPQQRWYWTNNCLLETPIFRRVMSEYRFSLIMNFLHFANNDEFDANSHPAPKLKKIWEVYQSLLDKFQTTYIPQRDISIDEFDGL